MEIIIDTNIARALEMLEGMGFIAIKKSTYVSAIRKTPKGRYHALIVALNSKKVFVELHYDSKYHFLCFGVDYSNRPRSFFRKAWSPKLENSECAYDTRNVTWFSRNNKAFFKGLKHKRLSSPL